MRTYPVNVEDTTIQSILSRLPEYGLDQDPWLLARTAPAGGLSHAPDPACGEARPPDPLAAPVVGSCWRPLATPLASPALGYSRTLPPVLWRPLVVRHRHDPDMSETEGRTSGSSTHPSISPGFGPVGRRSLGDGQADESPHQRAPTGHETHVDLLSPGVNSPSKRGVFA